MEDKKVWKKEINEISKWLKVDLNEGLSSNEVLERQEKYGFNILEESKKEPLILKLLRQFTDFTTIILLIAAAISWWLSSASGESAIDTIVILVVVFINGIIKFVQEVKAEKSLESLMKMTDHKVRVKRDGIVEEISSKDLVIGDVCIFEAGNYVPADYRIISQTALKAEESVLTGESVPVEKTANVIYEDDLPIGDRKNMLFSSSLLTYGSAEAVVISTGMDTEVGKIADMLDSATKRKTPLEQKLDSVGKALGIGCIVICIVIFIIGIFYGNSFKNMLMTSISLAVAAIPEGLPTIATIVLAIGVQRLAKKGTLVKKLPAVETLGSSSVICSDKTGTLTLNKMTVTDLYVNGQIVKADNAVFDETLNRMILAGMLCNNTNVGTDEILIGDPTETALVSLGFDLGLEAEVLYAYERIHEIPFDSDRKLMSVVYNIDGKYYVFSKGGVDEVLNICSMQEKNENILTKIDTAKEEILRKNDEMAKNALRVLAVSYKMLDSKPTKKDLKNLEQNQIFLGLFGMIDPPREEVKKSIEECKTAGIKTVMITGDHIVTAKAIAEDIGILQQGDLVLTGSELEKMSDKELQDNIRKISVYARVAPKHKVRIVEAWQKKGDIVAMTGDGVNDAPALKNADIGCAMGIAGTDVSKEAADLIITDDNFSTITEAVKEGRRIYQNILKAIQFLISSNIGEVVAIFLSILLMPWILKTFDIPANLSDLVVPLIPIQILWVNLVTDTFPALALAVDPAKKDIMEHPPEQKNTVFTKGVTFRVIYQGIMIGLLTFTAFLVGLSTEGFSANERIKIGNTMAFFVLALSELVHVYNVRDNEKTIFSKDLFNNKYLIFSTLISALLMLSLIAIPELRKIFNITLLDKTHLLWTTGFIFTPVLVVELLKLFGLNSSKEEKAKGFL